MKRSKLLPSIILLVLATGVASFWLGRTYLSASHAERLVQLERENGELKAAAEKLRSLNATLQDTLEGEQDLREKLPSATPPRRELSYIENIGMISALRDSLALANKAAEELKARATEQQAELEQLRRDQQRLAAIESDLTGQLASSKRLAEAKEAELTRKNEELKQFEAANKQLREDGAAARSKANRQSQTLLDELQEIYRRRESYLNTLLSRYREITEQYRAFSSVLENRRGPEGTPGASMSVAGPELSRIQNSITMAEEDLRQLNSLNAQALRIQKKLSGN